MIAEPLLTLMLGLAQPATDDPAKDYEFACEVEVSERVFVESENSESREEWVTESEVWTIAFNRPELVGSHANDGAAELTRVSKETGERRSGSKLELLRWSRSIYRNQNARDRLHVAWYGSGWGNTRIGVSPDGERYELRGRQFYQTMCSTSLDSESESVPCPGLEDYKFEGTCDLFDRRAV